MNEEEIIKKKLKKNKKKEFKIYIEEKNVLIYFN